MDYNGDFTISDSAVKSEKSEIECSLPEEELGACPDSPPPPKRVNLRKTLHCYLCPTNPILESRASLQRHLENDHPQKDKYHCDECNLDVTSITAFNQHLPLHDASQRPFRCTLCSKRFTRNSTRMKHEKMTHDLGKKPSALVTLHPPFCNVCNTAFNSTKEVVTHFRQAHPEEPQHLYQCGDCDAVFFLAETLRKHSYTHSNLYSCEHCGKQHQYHMDLAHHLLTVHAKRLDKYTYVRCPVCNKEFISGARYNAHMKTHDEIKNFACDFCDKRFGRHHVLVQHLISHGHGEPQRCDDCGKSFTRKSSLQEHKQKVCLNKLHS